ncbi:MAG: MFS transporter, partial [Dehalococcoidales bacterium]|nr:MFS transporter [Dehalococcoidales bacterium]
MSKVPGNYQDPGKSRDSLPFYKRTFTSFKNPVYRLYYGAMMGQMGAMNMQLMARSLLVYRLTGSAAILGGVALANALPMLFLSVFGGSLADRVQKKKVMLFGQIGSAIIALTVGLSLSLGYLSAENEGSWWILMVASALQGTIMGLMMPSRQAIIPEIVSDEELMNAVSLNTMGMNVLRIFAPAIAGFTIDAWDFQAVYYIMTCMFLVAVVFLLFMPNTGKRKISRRNTLIEIKEGLQYVKKEKNIILILLYTLMVVILSMPYMLLLPIFADDILKVAASGMGILIGVSGIGAIVGSVVLASLPNKKRGILLLLSGLVLG